MELIQQDYMSLFARDLVPLLKRFNFTNQDSENFELLEESRLKLLSWNFSTHVGSNETSPYESWYRKFSSFPSAEVDAQTWLLVEFLYQAFWYNESEYV